MGRGKHISYLSGFSSLKVVSWRGQGASGIKSYAEMYLEGDL